MDRKAEHDPQATVGQIVATCPAQVTSHGGEWVHRGAYSKEIDRLLRIPSSGRAAGVDPTHQALGCWGVASGVAHGGREWTRNASRSW
jgi:hypothetical protein